MSPLAPIDRYLDSRRAWRAAAHLPLARTSGHRVHFPDCIYVLSRIRVAEACIAFLEGRGPEPSGNVEYPTRTDAPAVTCRVCLARQEG